MTIALTWCATVSWSSLANWTRSRDRSSSSSRRREVDQKRTDAPSTAGKARTTKPPICSLGARSSTTTDSTKAVSGSTDPSTMSRPDAHRASA